MRNEYEKIGIYGGTFNPPHFGHVIAVKEARRALELDRVIVIPAAVPPHKELDGKATPASDRFEMTKLAFQEVEFAVVSDIEIRREGPSYTVDTLWELHEEYPGAVFSLIMGADMFMSIHQWKSAEEIFSLSRICGLSRQDNQTEELQKHAGFLLDRYGASCEVVKNPVVEISSSELREILVRGGESKFLQPQVYDYIKEKGLYSGD